jgi:hypothetical protein
MLRWMLVNSLNEAKARLTSTDYSLEGRRRRTYSGFGTQWVSQCAKLLFYKQKFSYNELTCFSVADKRPVLNRER